MNRQYPSSIVVNYQTKGKAVALAVNAGHQLACFNLRAFNNSGSSATVGILKALSNAQAGVSTLASAVYTAQGASFISPVQIFTGTNNDGFVIQHTKKFGLVGLTVSTGQTGGTFTYSYWNGSAFVTLSTLEVPAYTTTGDIWIVFIPPVDWQPGGGVGGNSSSYAIQVVSTTAPAGAVSVSNLWLGEFLDIYSGVTNNASVQLTFPDTKPFVLSAAEGVFPYFSVPSANNAFGAYYNNI